MRDYFNCNCEQALALRRALECVVSLLHPDVEWHITALRVAQEALDADAANELECEYEVVVES